MRDAALWRFAPCRAEPRSTAYAPEPAAIAGLASILVKRWNIRAAWHEGCSLCMNGNRSRYHLGEGLDGSHHRRTGHRLRRHREDGEEQRGRTPRRGG